MNNNMSSQDVDNLGYYIQGELTSEMSTPAMIEQHNKAITLMARAAKGDMEGKKIQIHKPFSERDVVHNSIVMYFEHHNVTIEKMY